MGGFLLVRSDPEAQREVSVKNGRDVFKKKGMLQRHHVEANGWELYLYDRIVHPQENLVVLGENDFVAGSGTLIYKSATGVAALRELYKDFRGGVDIEPNLLGNYCVILFAAGELTIFNDRNGYYRTYHDARQRIYSSSFLALQESLSSTTVAPHELYEYVFYGFFMGSKTLFEEILILDRSFYWTLGPRLNQIERPRAFRDQADWQHFDDCLEDVRANLLDYFKLLGSQFETFASALSGGYDSRLMVALLRNLKIPSYFYVYGNDQSEDVRVAKAIAAGEHFVLDHVDRGQFEMPSLDGWPEMVSKQYYFFDGTKSGGLFDNGSDYATRIDRCKKSQIQLNGAGGEIYREVWNISNRQISIDQFLRNQYDFGYFGFCTGRFKRPAFFENLKCKVRAILGVQSNDISRSQLEMLFPFLRNYFGAANVVVNNQLAPSLLPYVEPRFVEQSFQIPIEYKFHGRFHAALIRSIDPAIARYRSAYGVNFYDDVPLKTRIQRTIEMKMPIGIRVLNRRRRHQENHRPRLLDGDYFKSVFGDRPFAMSEFVNFDQIGDQEILARALTAELLIGSHPNMTRVAKR